MNLNTVENKEQLKRCSDRLIPLLYAIELLIKAECLTQENFELIQAEEKIDWLYALWKMPIELVNVDVWQGLVNLSITSNKNEFKKDIDAYVSKLRSGKIKKITWSDSETEINGRYLSFFSHSEESLVSLTEPSENQLSLFC